MEILVRLLSPINWEKANKILLCRSGLGDTIKICENGITIITRDGKIVFSSPVENQKPADEPYIIV